LLSYIDDGEIGDGWNHVKPVEDRVITSLGSECTIELIENVPSRTVFGVTNYMKLPVNMDYYVHGIRRSHENGILKIYSTIGLSKGSKSVDVETTINNTVQDHRLRLKLPTGIDTQTYFANQPFAFVERKLGIDLKTQSWKECDVPEKQMSGIALMRNSDKSGLAFVAAYGLHECAALDDGQGTMLITLFRSFKRTVMTNGEVGGQIQGELKFKYSITPVQPETTYADLIRLQDRIQAGIRTTGFRVSENYALPNPQSYFELNSEHICMSIMKRPESGDKNVIVMRLYNMSDKTSTATIKCFKEIKGVDDVNLNEEFVGPVGFDEKSIELEIRAWGIRTISIEFK